METIMTNMTRRSALLPLAALAISPLVPIVTLRPAIDREKLLSAFTASDINDYSGRYDINAPFAVGSLTYATDSRFACRAELTNRIESAETRRIPDITRSWDELWKPSRRFRFEPFQLPSIDSLTLGHDGDYGICPLCDGRRHCLGDQYPDQDWADSQEAQQRGYDVDDNSTYDPACRLCHGRLYRGPW